MKKLMATFLNDAKLSFRGLYFYIEIAMAAIFVLVMVFVVPDNFDASQHIYLLDQTQDQGMSRLFEDSDVETFEDRDALEEALEENRSAVGLVLSQQNGITTYDFVLQGFESDRMVETLRASVEAQFRRLASGSFDLPEVVLLEEKTEPLTNKQYILPIYLSLNIGLMGLFIIAAYIFLDKEEGVIKAFSVAPVRISQYLTSKAMIMVMTGLLTSIPTVMILHGFDMNYLYFSLAVMSFSFFGSALGLLISSFFDSMMKSMGALYTVIMLMILPSLTYFMPAFSPWFMKFIPSYHMLFTFRDILLNQGNTGYILSSIGVFALIGIGLMGLATMRFKKTLTV